MSRGTTIRAVRVPDELWGAAAACAEQNGETVSDVIRRALEAYAAAGVTANPPSGGDSRPGATGRTGP